MIKNLDERHIQVLHSINRTHCMIGVDLIIHAMVELLEMGGLLEDGHSA